MMRLKISTIPYRWWREEKKADDDLAISEFDRKSMFVDDSQCECDERVCVCYAPFETISITMRYDTASPFDDLLKPVKSIFDLYL